MEGNFYHWEYDDVVGFRKLILHIDSNIEKEIDKLEQHWSGEYKICSKCNKRLPACTYFFISGGKNSLHYQCKLCEKGKSYGWGRNYNYKLNDRGKHYCSKCDRVLDLNPIYFTKSKGKLNRTGYSSSCKECSIKDMSFGIYRINNCSDLEINEHCKICSMCHYELPDNDEYFFKKSDRKNGSVVCKKCRGFSYGIERLNIVYRDKTDDFHSFCSTCKKLKHVDNMSERHRCKECSSLINKIYYLSNPVIKERLRSSTQRRRNMKAKLVNDLSLDEYKYTLDYFDKECAYCGLSEEEHKEVNGKPLFQDHIIPMIKGGGYTKSNIIPACWHCNSSKGSKDLVEYYEYKKSFTEERLAKIITFLDMHKDVDWLNGGTIFINRDVEKGLEQCGEGNKTEYA